jgi:SAM-dependent methyltransferase
VADSRDPLVADAAVRLPAGQLREFYERTYSHDAASSAAYGRWRALGAIGKADHVVALCERQRLEPRSTLDVGCGDGALLGELHARGFGGRLYGVELSEAAAALARGRPQIAAVGIFDGRHLEAADAQYDLGILSHVLEHVPEPAILLGEVARACRFVVVEVPLEANVSARRAGKRAHAAEVGHLHRLSRSAVRAIVARAGLSVACELQDPLPLSVQRFFANTPTARVAATLTWALRTAIHAASPALARRLFSVHYACLCRARERRAVTGA